MESQPIQEKMEKYNFQEVADLKERMVSLCQKMKENIESGKYHALISDEIGGRIPTLILRKVIKLKHPNGEIKTLFLASGNNYLPYPGKEPFDDYVDLIQKRINPEDHVLLVTQYIHYGNTIRKLTGIIKCAGIQHLDIAAARSGDNYKNMEGADNIYIGDVMSKSEKIDDESIWYAGVAKRKDGSDVYPTLLRKVIAEEGRGKHITEEQSNQIFGITGEESREEFYAKLKGNEETNAKYKEFEQSRLTEEEEKELQQRINKVRQDIDTLAKEIVDEVWNKL